MKINFGNNEVFTVSENIVPNDIQHLVLKAALCEYDEAIENWKLLKQKLLLDQLDLDKITGTILSHLYDKLDVGSTRLLPMVYKNLKMLDDPILQSIKSLYNYTWAKNHYFYSCAKEIEKICITNNTNLTLLKGLAIAFHYCDDPAIRVMDDVDVLIDKKKANKVISTLKQKYTLRSNYKLRFFLGTDHSATFKLEKTELDVHWRLTTKFFNKLKVNANDKNILRENKDKINVLNPTYAFFHSIIHGVSCNQVPTIRWISDCNIIASQNQINWEKVLDLGKQINGIVQLYIAINILPAYGVAVPDFVINKINNERQKVYKSLKYQLKFKEQIIFMLNENSDSRRSKVQKIYDNTRLYYYSSRAFSPSYINSIINIPRFILSKALKSKDSGAVLSVDWALLN